MSVPPYNRIPEVPQIVIRGEAWRFNGRLTDRQGAILTWAGYSMGLEIWPAFSGPGADNPFYTAESSEVTLEPNGTFEINIAGTKTAAWTASRARYVLRLAGPGGPRTIIRGQLDIQPRKGERNV